MTDNGSTTTWEAANARRTIQVKLTKVERGYITPLSESDIEYDPYEDSDDD